MKPREIVAYYGKVYPGIWKKVDYMISQKGIELPTWPEWCFLPLAGAYSIVWEETMKHNLTKEEMITNLKGHDIGNIGALATWRATQGVYRFDNSVYESVINTDITGNIPHEILFNLPEWCLYIETPDLTFIGMSVLGFFVHLEHDINTERKELRFVLNIDTKRSAPSLIPLVIHLGSWSLLESIKRAAKESLIQVSLSEKEIEIYDISLKIMEKELTPLLSLVLYICSVNGEIGNGRIRPKNPLPKKTKEGLRVLPPKKAKVWGVGERMGAAIRRDKENQESINEPNKEERASNKERTSPRSHIRRAHWHGYWTGPKKEPEKRKYILKWIQPVLVNPNAGDLSTVIRPVE